MEKTIPYIVIVRLISLWVLHQLRTIFECFSRFPKIHLTTFSKIFQTNSEPDVYFK